MAGGNFAWFGDWRLRRPRRRVAGHAAALPSIEPVALAVQLQNVDMMREAIEQRASETLAAEYAGPFLNGKIRP